MPAPPRSLAVAELSEVGVSFADRDALRGVGLHLDSGTFTAIVGANGAGKSTLLEVLAGARLPTTGRVSLYARSRALVPQQAAVAGPLPVTLRDIVSVGAWGAVGLWRPLRTEGRRRVDEAISSLGLSAIAHRPFGELSGGQQQRALLAQGLARGADLLLLDEPTTGLDDESSGMILAAVAASVRKGTTVVCVSHDDPVIERADRVVRLRDGEVESDIRNDVPSRR